VLTPSAVLKRISPVRVSWRSISPAMFSATQVAAAALAASACSAESQAL
jgi:hypothetical protein